MRWLAPLALGLILPVLPLLPAQAADDVAPPSRDLTLDLRDDFVGGGDRDGWTARVAGAAVAPRPSDPPTGTGEVRWDPQAPRERLCGTQVCVHFVTTSSDAPPLDPTDGATSGWVRRNLAVAEAALVRMAELGYPAPPSDGARGGGPEFDVYLADISRAGLYGYCAPEAPVPGAPGHASSYCVFDNDFRGFPMPPDASLRVTAAHELFHAVQFGMDVHEDRWFLEATATWMEEQVADDVDDNRQFLPFGQLAQRRTPLDLASAGLGSYGNWIFFQFLAQRHGVDAVRQVWARADAGPGRRDDFSVQALRRFVESRGGQMKKVYRAFATANLLARRSYDEGRRYRTAAVDRTVRPGPRGQAWRAPGIAVPHLSSYAVALRPLTGPRGGSRVRITVDARRRSGAAAVALVLLRSGTTSRVPFRLDGRGRGARTVRFRATQVRRVVVLLTNGSTRYRCGLQTQLACRGESKDDRQRIAVSAEVLG